MQASRLRFFFVISGIILLVIALYFLGILKPIENLAFNFFGPLMSVSYKSKLAITENDKTSSEVLMGDLKVADAQKQLLILENNELRAQLNFFSRQTYRHLGAEVIGRTIDGTGSSVLINRGWRDGIKLGDPVVVGNGLLVGKVGEVSDAYSWVNLLTDHRSKVAATVLNFDRSLGIVAGGYELSVQMTAIPQNEKVLVGDTIVTSGLEKNIPSGLVIGTVQSITKEAYQPFQEAIVEPLAPLDKLYVVSVILADNS